ncbi:MAG: zeta toxin family protein [Campylobacteraceae bacterium]|jgi:predicted ABC-type ATPase|nr:zeta toxin family protein [Campylobacteraceae bacterium]
MPNLIIVAGTNGVGKSTFGHYLNRYYNLLFINTDEFYKNMFGGFYQYGVEELKKGTAAIRKLQNEYFAKQQSFAVERILYREDEIGNLISRARENGYKISLIYIGITDIELSKKRISQRVKQGGHDVDFDLIKENLDLSIQNFTAVCAKADNIILYDNSNEQHKYKRVIDIRDARVHLKIDKIPNWSKPFIDRLKMLLFEKWK